MEYEKLRDKVKSLGLRVTKDVKGKRVKLTKGELKAKLPKKSVAAPSLENQAKSAKKFIRVCKMVLREAEPRERRVVMAAPVRAASISPHGTSSRGLHQPPWHHPHHPHHDHKNSMHVQLLWPTSKLTSSDVDLQITNT